MEVVNLDQGRSERRALDRGEHLLTVCLELFGGLPHLEHVHVVVAISGVEQAPFWLTCAEASSSAIAAS